MGNQKVHIVLFREGDDWVADCIEYSVASQGVSEEHAMAMIQEAVELHVEDLNPEELERIYVPVDSTPVVRELIIRAPSLLNG